MNLPLIKKIRRRDHIERGTLQDIIVDIVYSIQPDAVLHGGTGLWRCFNGNRFSDDLDFYFIPNDDFEKKLKIILSAKRLELKKYKTTDNTLFSNISDGNTDVKLEASFQKKNGTLTSYEQMDGSFIDILSLTPKEYFFEKLQTYQKRRLIRDIYDVYFLSNIVDLDSQDRTKLKDFLQNIPKPVDEENLKAIILIGLTPTFDSMVLKLKRLL